MRCDVSASAGPDSEKIIHEAEALDENGASLRMHPGIDHADESIHGYGVLINPSTSDVLCTVSVEALAMGKHIVLARHVSNNFFEQFEAGPPAWAIDALLLLLLLLCYDRGLMPPPNPGRAVSCARDNEPNTYLLGRVLVLGMEVGPPQ